MGLRRAQDKVNVLVFYLLEILLDGILNRMPIMNDAQIRLLTNGPESFTPDKNWILGQSSEVR